MANNLTDAAEILALNWLNGVGTPTRPTTPLKVVLYTTMPNQETGVGGVQVSGGGYAAQNVTFGSAAAGSASNTADVVFGPATADWGSVVGAGITDNAGSLLWSGSFGTPRTVSNTDTFTFPAGQITVSLD